MRKNKMLEQGDVIHIVDATLLYMSNGIKDAISNVRAVEDDCTELEFMTLKFQIKMLKDVFWESVKLNHPELVTLLNSPKYVELSHDCRDHVIKVEKVSERINDGKTIDDMLDNLGLDRPSLIRSLTFSTFITWSRQSCDNSTYLGEFKRVTNSG